MRLTPDTDRVRAAAIAPSTSNITAAEFDRFVAKIKADAWQEGWDAGAGWPQDDTNPHKDAS